MKPDSPLSLELLQKMNAYWRAANYLSVGQLYLCDNPLLRKPLEMSHVKSMLLGHWGTTPGQNFIYVHLNRVIRKYDPVSYTHLRAHETGRNLVCRLLLEK